MERVYLSKAICDAIHEARREKGMTSRELADSVGKCPSWMSRVENFKATHISRDEADALSQVLGVVFVIDKDAEILAAQIRELMEENKLLKKLLAEKWLSE